MRLKNLFKVIMGLFSYSLLLLFFTSCETLNHEKDELQKTITLANNYASISDYKLAVKMYIDAIILAENSDPDKVYSIRKSLSETYIDWSRELYWKAKTDKSPELFEEAIYLCEKALEVNPKYKVKCEVYISKFQKELSSIRYKSETSIKKLIPDNEDRKYKIAILFKQAELLRNEEKYMMAVEKLEEIIVIDPFNIDAARKIKKIMKKVAEIAKERIEADETTRIAEMEWKNIEPIAEREEAMEEARREAEAGVELRLRLANCEIDKIDFKEVPLDKAYSELRQMIIKKINTDFKFEFNGFNPADKSFAPVTFQAKSVPAEGAIEALCDGFNMFPTYSSNLIIIQKRSE